MKSFFGLILIGIISALVISCDLVTDKIIADQDISLLEDEVRIYQAYEEVDNQTLQVLQENGLGARVMNIQTSSLCPTAITSVDKTAKKITIDFGTGCSGPDGKIRQGKVILNYTGNIIFPGTIVNTTFEGYEVNGLLLEGTRTLTNTGVNLATNTITMTVKVENGKITWPDKTFATMKMNQIREIKLTSQGYEISATGTGQGKSRSDYNYTTLITTPLIISQTCIDSGIWAPNSGVMQFSYKGIKSNIDYGLGTCDKNAKFSYPGGSKDVTFD